MTDADKNAEALKNLAGTAKQATKRELSEYELDMLALDEGSASLAEFLAPHMAAAAKTSKGK